MKRNFLSGAIASVLYPNHVGAWARFWGIR